MKLFAVRNGASDSDFELNEDMIAGGSNAHSGGAVILAEDIEKAKEILLPHIKETGTLIEIPLDKAGIVLLADGDC